ncbi:MAG TPA: TRAP transporter fused permease subunit [Thermoanaerobacterales bacterium]|nr:TRAP transporter fused permease subunit [Thermoanaerobacterales bacterium]
MNKADNFLNALIKGMFIVNSLIFIYISGFGSFSDIVQRALLLILLCSTIFVTHGLKIKGKQSAWTRILDLLLATGMIISGVYVMAVWQERILKSGISPVSDVVMGTMAVILILEATRRTTGKFLAVTVLLFIIYALVGPYMPGFLAHRGETWDRLITFLYMTTEGIFGVPLGIAASYIIMFVIFGAFLESFGAGQWFVDTAYAITGRFRGGPAKTAILSSALMGMISGSSAANVVTTGSFTIPLMKKVGYKPHVAGAIEAVASTGGMFTPPIMGAGAFIMAEYLGMPYLQIAKAAILCAVLYYFSLMLTADAIAVKSKLMGLPPESLPNIKKVMHERGFYAIPILLLIFMIIKGWSPMKAAFWCILIIILIAFFTKDNKPSLKLMLNALENGSRQTVSVVATCSAAGVIVGIISITGLGAKLSYTLLSVSNGNVYLAAIISAIITIILGCGMPPTAVYIILAAVLAPPLIKMGILPIAAHMFIFIFSCVGALTPPVAITAYTAAAIADSDPSKTGWTAFRFGITAYIIPFLFLLFPSLLLVGNAFEIITTTISSMIGICCLTAANEGFFIWRWGTAQRILLGIAALLLLKPGILTDAIGLLLIFAAILSRHRRTKEYDVKKELKSV